MDNKQSREHLNPLRKKMVSPQGNRKWQKSTGISSKVKANMKEFHKFSQKDKKDTNLKKKLCEMKKDKSLKYHLGGSSYDPLNLYSLIDRDPMLNTPQASPHPMHGDSPIEVSCPHDYKDPLNLKRFPEKDGPTPKKKKKRKHKTRQHDIENNEQKDQKSENQEMEKSEKPKERKKKKGKKVKCNTDELEVKGENKGEIKSDVFVNSEVQKAEVDQNCKKDEAADDEEPPRKKAKKWIDNLQDKISDVDTKDQQKIGENTAAMSGQDSKIKENDQRTPTPPIQRKEKQNLILKKKDFKKSPKLFIYGNYNRYYNYRNPQSSVDPRTKCFRKEWFYNKDVLDIGCNVGNITFEVARQFEPRIIIGSDIDNSLIKMAKTNAQVFAYQNLSSKSSSGKEFPLSFAVTNGPIAAPVLLTNDKRQEKLEFPKNVIFKQENYVPLNEKGLSNQRPMFDTILCLSVTKWVHLNWGDQGIKLMFKKIYRNLRPGGRLILEPQPFASYSKRKKLTTKIRANYDSICFRPEQFVDYLLSDEVGFVAYEVLEEPQHGAQGFRRPMYLFTKGTNKIPQAKDKAATPNSR
ncbi:probable RNA methyltransferase At5g51130 [Actinia tenebrosa]|uniref:RNA methyltransferase n=1 Tax=Actinia tenebrosa TaxID=6105 RepID=A0A6P8I8B5_ACTTE|nr:probable RNA methyltransferase At5g51130 [Actinia tenebrosa]